jgi:hypothetical protein
MVEPTIPKSFQNDTKWADKLYYSKY